MTKTLFRIAAAGLILLSMAASAATSPDLRSLRTYAIVAGTYNNGNNAAPPPNITALFGTPGLPVECYTTLGAPAPLTIVGTTDVPCPPTRGTDENLVLGELNAQALDPSCRFIPAGTPLEAVVLPGQSPGVYTPGCYRFGGAINLTANTQITLTGGGTYIFSSVGALTTGDNSRVILANGACSSDVFWAPGGATTLGAHTTGGVPAAAPEFNGNIVQITDITVGHFANINGRLLAFAHVINTDADTITVPTCISTAALGNAAVPTLSEWSLILLASLLAMGGIATLRARK
jgi:hypothetical protein